MGVKEGLARSFLTCISWSTILLPMSMHERRFRDHTPEKISALAREAVKLVPVDEFLQLRFQKGISCDAAEYKQIHDAEDVIRKMAEKNGKTYDLTDDIKRTLDPRIGLARLTLTAMPLPKYLTARHELLEAAIASTIHLRNECELSEGYVKEVEKLNERLSNRLADLNLTNSVIASLQT